MIYLTKEVTIEITDFCPHGCIYCSTNSINDKNKAKFLKIKKIKKFIKQYIPIKRINISGGEPLAHPKFYEILQLCKKYCDNVWVYTNSLNQILYNSDIIKEIKIEANCLILAGKHIYIPKNTTKNHLLKFCPQGKGKNLKDNDYHISNNFIQNCNNCSHNKLLKTNGEIVKTPCNKNY